ncbi:MAG: LuxR C-terminal-related transcriptional regulator [Candidatus Spyradocola sp.]
MGDRSSLSGFIRAEQEQIIRDCGFTEREERVFRMRARGASVVETSLALNYSERTVKRDSRSVRAKIARAGHRRT